VTPQENVALAPQTTLRVGGPARYFAALEELDDVARALAWAAERDLPVEVLGGGSNVLIADRGLNALVIRVRADRITPLGSGRVDVDAGVCWDAFVAWAVARDEAGVECLSGIPGDVGAAPMQNVGAYGQEVSETIEQVVAIDRLSGEQVVIEADACAFGYRDSVFKHAAAGQYVVVRVRFRLTPGGPAKIVYPELERAIDGDRSLATVRETVVQLRRKKSMVLDERDDNRRSAGSFFVNPTLEPNVFAELQQRVTAELGEDHGLPSYPAVGGLTKVPAAWLIERAGMGKGTRRGNVGISSKHSLAIVNHGRATASELVAFAAEVRRTVRGRFGVTLTAEPRLLGFDSDETRALVD
jgi:UDP-N-acetylmuramate dehydrogenase